MNKAAYAILLLQTVYMTIQGEGAGNSDIHDRLFVNTSDVPGPT